MDGTDRTESIKGTSNDPPLTVVVVMAGMAVIPVMALLRLMMVLAAVTI